MTGDHYNSQMKMEIISNNIGTMLVRFMAYAASGYTEVTCSSGDTCTIKCETNSACSSSATKGTQITCDGTCVIYCDSSLGLSCPYIVSGESRVTYIQPTRAPSSIPTIYPTKMPSHLPTQTPSFHPSTKPTDDPTLDPTALPTMATTIPTIVPTQSTMNPTEVELASS